MAKAKNTPPTDPDLVDRSANIDTTPERPLVGDTVLYVLPEHDVKGRIRPATIVQVFPSQGDGMPLVNMQQLTDGLNDNTSHPVAPATIWRTSVHYDQDGKQPGTWHWPEADPAA